MIAFTLVSGFCFTNAAERMALVIGNGAYRNASRLANAGNDADAVGAALKDAGFTVSLVKDVSIEGFYDALAAFGKTADGARLGLVYYAGHGIEVDGKNYLLPVDAVLEKESQLNTQAVAVQKVMETLDRAHVQAKMMVLDCCRDNPLTRSWKGSRSVGAGLAGLTDTDLPSSTLVMFAAAPGKPAQDGTGKNSPFTTALVEQFRKPGQSAFEAFRNVAKAVAVSTGQRQVPWLKFDGAGLAFDEFSFVTAGANTSTNSGVIPPAAVVPVLPLAPVLPEASGMAVKRAGEERHFEIAPGVTLAMCGIPAGSFTMGGTGSDETPHKVTLTKSFWLGRTEVTQEQWEAVMGNKPSYFKGKELPVEKVSWDDASEFCKKLNGKGLLPAGWKFALPTEAQWEYACRAGTTGDYAGSLDEMTWYGLNSGDKTHAVGTKKANAWGLHDMHGNVWEWCADWYGTYPANALTDPTGANTGVYRVFRGGSWDRDAARCRAAHRDGFGPGLRSYALGFRPALVPSR